MENKVKYIFITGLPKSGKTTLIKKIVSLYKSETVGFYTEEILDTKN
ncbi:MAG: nucleoside-triphosphatase, partial [Endomicrobiia bacterium]